MRHPLIFLFTILSLTANGQSSSTEDIILHLISEAVSNGMLPIELINKKDSIDYRHNAVVLQTIRENGLQSGVLLKRDDIEYGIWTAEELFTRDPYWMTPFNIKMNAKRISFNFTTSYMNMSKKKCFEGLIKGKKVKGIWVLKDSSSNETPCKVDLKKLSEESNAR